MKKFFPILIFAMTIFTLSSVQAQTNFNLNKNFDENFVNFTTGRVPEGAVVNIQTYLSIRAEPSIYSRELARVPNRTRLGILENYTYDGFYHVACWWSSSFITGYAHSSFVTYTGGYFDLP